jgi:hypothetical protein
MQPPRRGCRIDIVVRDISTLRHGVTGQGENIAVRCGEKVPYFMGQRRSEPCNLI